MINKTEATGNIPPRPPEGKPTHNPPWHYAHGKFTPDECGPFDAYRISITDTDGSEVMLAIIPESKENAEFICKAVNLNEKLVAALETVLPYIENLDDQGPEGERWQSDALVNFISTIKTLLAEAREKSK